MTTPIGYGIDVSHWQSPDLLPWKEWLGKVDFVIARASYGRTVDASAKGHIGRARDIGAKVGVYGFFRVVEDVKQQHDAIRKVCTANGLDSRDIVPALDIEADMDRAVEPSWSEPARELVDMLVDTFGNCLVYCTQREWHMMGSPAWALKRPLWCAHYTAAPEPATPGGLPATIWQHRVGPFEAMGPGGSFPADLQIDQNRLLRPLPLIGQVVTPEERDRIEGLIALSLSEGLDLGPATPKDIV